jgi:hypothetical protein
MKHHRAQSSGRRADRDGDTGRGRLPRGLRAAELSTDDLAAGDRFERWSASGRLVDPLS